eukprot:SAG31_NODE_28273_length_412_cov_1.325879_1_plen_46_part_10
MWPSNAGDTEPANRPSALANSTSCSKKYSFDKIKGRARTACCTATE